MLRIEALSRRFGGLEALSGIEIEVGEGEVLGLIGPNGSGKTTLFNVITGLYPASEGRVVLRGRDVTRLAPHKLVRGGGAGRGRTPPR